MTTATPDTSPTPPGSGTPEASPADNVAAAASHPPAHPANSGARVDVNPAGAVARNAALFPDTVAVRYEGGDLSYAELDDRAARFARVLLDGGTTAGDRVAFVGLNSTSFLVTMLGTFRVGAIFVPVNFRLAGPELQRVLTGSGSTVVVAEEGHRDAVESVCEGTDLRRLLLVDDDPAVPAAAAPGWESWSPLIGDATAHLEVPSAQFDDTAVLMFTSGTTGDPKGVVLTYGNVWWNQVNVGFMLDCRRGDVTLAAAPIFHIGALNSFVLRTLTHGGTAILRRRFDPEEFVADLVGERVNTVFAVPAMLQAAARVPALFDSDLSALRSVVVAAAPVPPSLIREYAGHGVLLQQAWGLTETAPFATHLPAEWTLEKVGSAGVAMPYTEVRVVSAEDNQPLPTGTPGEVVVRGPNVTPGYWQNPEATRTAFDDDGWFHSGDIGYLDEQGCLFIVDRLKDMIISGGENVYPAEVERALADLPGALDVAVVGAPDEKWGEAVVAVVSLADGVDLTLEQIRDHASTTLARYKLPTRLHVLPSVPRNASGKLEKREIRAKVESDEGLSSGGSK